MKREMKEYSIRQTYGGVQFYVIVVAETKKTAAKLLDETFYRLNNWAHIYTPKTPEAIKEPYKLWAYYDSGFLREYVPELYNKVVPLRQLKQTIDEVNKIRHSKFLKSLRRK